MPQHIGIVACSAEGASLCYRTICAEGARLLVRMHIAEVVAAEASRRGYRRLGLTGTRWLVESPVYPEKLTAQCLDYLLPTAEEREETSRIIMDELVYGEFKPESIAYFQAVIERCRVPAEERRLTATSPDADLPIRCTYAKG